MFLCWGFSLVSFVVFDTAFALEMFFPTAFLPLLAPAAGNLARSDLVFTTFCGIPLDYSALQFYHPVPCNFGPRALLFFHATLFIVFSLRLLCVFASLFDDAFPLWNSQFFFFPPLSRLSV